MKKLLCFVIMLITVAGITPLLNAQDLPELWNHADIGVTPVSGSATFEAETGTFTISGSGLNWWDKDDGHFAYVQITGDFTFKARCVTFEGTLGGAAKTGIDARNNLDSMVTSVMMAWEDWGGLATTARENSVTVPSWEGGTQPGAGAIPWWLQMVRVGDTIYTSESVDNVTWTKVTKKGFSSFLPTMYVGLAISPNAMEISTATFDSVHITGNVVASVANYKIASKGLQLYPNPAEANLTVEYKGNSNVQSIMICDLKGSVIRKIATHSTNNLLPVSDLAPGMYFIKLETNQGSLLSKFIRK